MSTRYRLTLPDGKKKYIKSEDYDRFGADKLMTAFPGATLHSEDPNTGDEFEWGVADLKHSDFYGLRPRNYDGVDADGNKTEVVEDTNNLDGDAGKQKVEGAELGTEMTEAPENGGVNTAIGGDGQPSMAAKTEEVGEVNKNEGVTNNEGVTKNEGVTEPNGNAQETATNGNAQGSGVKRDVTEGVKNTGAKQETEAKKLVADYAVSRQANSAMRSKDFEQFMSAMAGTQAPSRLKNTYEAIRRGQNDVSQPKMDFQTVHRAAEASKNRAAFKKVTDMVDEAIAKASGEADKASHEAFVEGLTEYENTPFAKRGGDRLANMLLSKKEANRLATTDKVLAVVKKQMEKFAETPEFAKLMYITGKHKDELLKDYLLPYAQDKVIGHAVEKYTPGSTGEYYLKNLRNTLLGRGITMLTEPLSMRQQEQAALEGYGENLGFWTKLGSEGLNLAFDLVTTMPIFEGTGAVVGKLAYTGNALRLNRAGLNMYNAFSVASRMGGRTANFANRLMTSAGFFGSMDATNSAFAQWQLKNPDEFSFSEVAKSGAFGLATGASIGALGYGTSLLGRGRGLLAKSGISVMGATAEAGAMTGTGYVEWLLGDQKEKFDWTENFGKNMLMIGALRANGVFKGFFGRVFQLTKPGADGKAPMSTGQAFVRAGKELPGMLLGEMPNDRNLDKEEIRSVNEQGFAGKDTGEIVKNILEESGLSIQDVPEPIRNGSKEDQLQWLMTNTRIGDFMGNANIPEGAKDKMSYYFGAEMPNRIYTMASQPYEDGNGGWVIDLYSTNGSAGVGTWSKRMRFDTEAQADVWVGEHYGEIQRNRIYDLELQMMHKRQAEIDAAVIDMVAKNNGVNADEVFRIYDEGRNGKYDDWKKGKKGEGAWTNEDAFMYENLMRMAVQVADKRMNQKNTAVEATALRTGRKPEEVSEIISQNWKDRKPEDQEVVDVYQHVLESRLKYGDEVAEEAPISALKIEDKRVKDLEGVAVPEGDAYFQQDFRGIGIEAKEVQGAAAESLSEAEMQHISDMFERGESNEDMVAWVSTLPKEKQEAAFALIKSNKVLQAEVAGMEVMVNGQVQKFTDGMLPFLAPGTRNYTIAKLDGKQVVYVVGQEGNMMYVKYQDGTYDNVHADRLSYYVTTNLDEAATDMFNETMQRMGAELEFSLEHSPRTVEPSQGATIETADGMLMVVGADGERVQMVHTQYDPETGQMKPKSEQPVVMSRDEALQAQDDWHEKDMKPTKKAATKDGGEEPAEEPKKEVEEEPSTKTGEEPAEEPKEPAEETEKAEGDEAENVPESPESVPESPESVPESPESVQKSPESVQKASDNNAANSGGEAPVVKSDAQKRSLAAQKAAWTRKQNKNGERSKEWKDAKKEFEQAGYKDLVEMIEDTEPRDIYDVAAMVIAGGDLMYYDEKVGERTVRGVASATGYKEDERKRMFSLFRGRAKGGISIDEAGDIVTQYCREMGIPYDEDDAMAGYNAIVDVLHSSHTTGDVKFYTQKRRVDQARAMFDEHEEQRVMYEREKAAEEKAASRRSSLEIMRDLDVAKSMEDRNRLLYELYEAKQLEATEGANIGDEIKGLIAEEASLIRELANYDTDTEEFKQAHKDLMEVQDEIRQVLSEMKDSELQEMANLSFINDRNNRVARAIKAEVAKRVADEEEVLREAIAKQEEEVNTNPTEAQKKAGNYKMGHVKVDGYEISIENPKGSTRSGKDADGKEWSVTMNNSYGYIRGTEGVDGDHIDIFLSDKPSEGNVYVVDQVNADGSFDEHKVMYGFTSMEEAKKAYLANYSEGWQGLGKITEVSKDDFKEWVNSSHRKTKPFADYKAVLDRQAQHAARLSELSADEIDVHNQDVAENGGLVVDDNSKQIGADNMAMLDLLGKSIGRQIILMTGEEMLNQYKISGRGTYDGDKIIMNLDDIQSNIAGSKTGVSAMAWIRGHEMTHALRDDNHPAVWNAFVNVVKEAMGDKFDKEFARKRALYDAEFATAKKNGAEYQPLTDDDVTEEVVANWIGYNDPFGDNTEARKMMEDAISRSEDAETLTGIILGYLKHWLRKLESMYKYVKGEAAAEIEKQAYATRVAIEAWKGMYNVAVAKNKARVEARGGKLKFAIKEPNFEENKERFGEIERQVQQIDQAIYDSKDIRDLEKRNETIRSLNEQRDRLMEEYEALAEAEKIAKKMFGLTDKDFELPKGASVGAYKDGTGKSTGFVQMEFSFPEDDGIAELGSKGEGVKDKKEKKEKTPVDFKLRKLKPGEKCYVERRYVENGMFDFSGKEKVETADDVAYIFRNLEDSAIENLFFVLLKDGKPTIIHAGMGGLTGAPADNTAVISAVENIKPDSIIMLHNHPSGNLTPSAPDVNAHKELRKMFGDKLQDSIIIDQKSGKYSTFNDHGFIDKQQRPENQDGTVGHKVYNFSKNVFSKDYEFDKKITSADDVAAFVSSQRLGDRGKLGLLSLSNSNVLNANLFLTQNNITDSNVGKIADEVIRFLSSTSGKRGIVFGSGDMPAISKLSEAVRDKSANMFRLMDAVRVNGNSDQYESAYEKGLMEPESQYGKDDVIETTDNGSYVERRKGRIRFSLETFEDAENQKLAEAVANTSKLPKEEVQEILSDVKEVAERIVPLLDLHPDFKTAQERTLALDKNGRPTYNVYFNNKDTKAPTIEFSTNCVKKEAINNLFSALRQEGILHLMNGDNSIFEAVLDVMKKHGYQLPCDACFVEARRNQQGIKKDFAGKWNTIADLIKLPKDVYITDNVEVALDQKQEKKLREALTKYGLASTEGRIINIMLKDPSTRARFNVEDLMTVDAYEQMMQKWSGTPMEGLLKSFAGASTPKPIRTSHPYDERMFNTAYAELHPFFGESGLAYGGFRENSFSDGDPLLFFDEVQMRRNLALTQSGMFGYTKVPFMVDIFGETGEFRNMSLWLDIDIRGDEVSEKNKKEDPRYQYAGLIKVGDPEHQRSLGLNDEEYEAYKSENGLTADDYDFYFSKESFPWREAMSFRKEDRFGGRVGTVVVSPSDECTWKALSDERVDMIIGYHSSGKSKEGKNRTGYNLAKDYTGENETGGIRGLRFANSYLPEMNIYAPTYFNEEQGGVDFNFDEACQTMGDARTAANAYLEWCEINDLSPKYERFKEHENYYKLLINFRRYDNAGSPLIQGAVKMKLPQDWATKLDMYLSEREDLLNKNNEVANDAELMKDVRKVLGVDGDDPKPKRRKTKFALKDEDDFAGNSVSETKKRDEEYADAVKSGNRERAMEMLREEADKKLNEQLVLPTDEGVVGFQYHRGPAPKKVIPMYAVLNVTPEGFKAAYAGNQTGTPVGVWLDAQPLKSWPSDIKKNDDGSESRYVAGDTGASWKDMFTPETYEKMMAEDPSITKGTRWLYERGGKHGTDVPNFQQMNTKTDENGNKVTSAKYGALPHNKLIFEIECGMDEDGDLTAYVEKNGRFVKKKNQGLDWVGTNKFYFFKTNPNAVGNWGIAGTFRIKRLVPHDEIVEECKKAGVPIQKWAGGYHPEDSGLSVEKVDEMYEQGKEQKLMDITYDDNGELIPLSKRFDTKKRDIRFALNEPEDPGRKPRKRRGESEREYERRLEEWKRKKQEYEDAIANGWTPVDRDNDTVGGELDKLKLEEMMDPSPGRGRDESQEDYDVRYEAWKERDNARRQRMEELRQENLRHQAELGEADDMTDDQHLWEGSVPPQDEWGEDMTIEEYREMREKMGEVGTDLGKSWSKKQMKKDIHEEIIQRRKFMEESNLEDVFFTEDLKSVAKKAGDDWKNILRDVPYFIEYDKTVERLKQEELGQRFEAGERDLTIDDIDVSYNPFQSRKENRAILEEVAKMVEDWFQDAYNLMNEEGVLFGASKLEDYVTHIWDFDKSPADAVEKYKRYRNALRMRSPYTRHRVLPSLQEGLEMGLVPKYEDITGIILDYGHRMNEVIANKRLVDFIRQFALEVDNGEEEPTLMPILIPEWKKDPDYVRVDNESLENYRVLRDAVPFISPVFGRQRVLDPTAHPELQKWLDRLFWNPSNLMKKLNLSASFFHHGALTETAIALTNPVSTFKGLSKNIFWDWLYKGNVPAMVSREETRDAVRHLVSLGATNDYAATEVQNLTTQLKQMLEKMPAKGVGSYYVAAALDFLNAKSDKLLWDVIHDGFKLRSYTKMATEVRKQAEKEGWSIDKTDKALDEIGQFVNDTFGGQHWDVLGISPMKERMLRAMLLSPDWTISTIRQALAPLGVGTLYESDSFWQKMRKNGLGKTLSDTTPEGLRKKYGRHFWLKAGLFFGIMVNALNAWNRLKDEDEQKKMADERRKTDPGYKSPYELAYPDGMKWYDYTMFGNSVGQTSHLFIGRDDKGREAYARWGKQFRELPELFIDNQSGQFTFPGAMINKMAGKANPLVGTMFTLLSGHSLSGWENEDMKDKKGREKDVARLFVLAKSFMPYSIPKDDDKEFMLIDLVMPTSKGLSNYKARQYMEKAILSGDMDYVQEVYKACVQNGIDPDKIFEVVKSTIESDAKKEMLDGVENIDDAIREYDSSIDVEKKKKLAKFIEKQLSAQDYEQIEMADLLGKAQSFLNGDSESEEKNAEYIARSSSEDVIADWRMKKVKAGVQKYYDTYKSLLGEDDDFDSPETKEAADYLRQNKDRIALYQLAGKYQYRINKMKKMLDEGVYGTAVFKMIKACKEDFFEKAEHPSEAMEDETWEEFDFDDAEDVNDAR